MQLTKQEFERFWQKVDIPDFRFDLGIKEGCWPWTAARSSAGYGSFKLRGSAVCASRLSLIIATGSNPEDRQALHTCDNPECVRPSHLKWGTVRENARDMMDKGRGRGQFIKTVRTFTADLDAHDPTLLDRGVFA